MSVRSREVVAKIEEFEEGCGFRFAANFSKVMGLV